MNLKKPCFLALPEAIIEECDSGKCTSESWDSCNEGQESPLFKLSKIIGYEKTVELIIQSQLRRKKMKWKSSEKTVRELAEHIGAIITREEKDEELSRYGCYITRFTVKKDGKTWEFLEKILGVPGDDLTAIEIASWRV